MQTIIWNKKNMQKFKKIENCKCEGEKTPKICAKAVNVII